MKQIAVQTAHVVLIDPTSKRSHRIARAIGRDHRLSLLACCKRFEDAYNLTEAQQPAIVAIASDLLSDPGFPMYKALLDGLKIRATILCPPGGDVRRYARMGRVIELDGDADCDALTEALHDGLLPAVPVHGPAEAKRRGPGKIVVIGASTGGVEALSTVLSHFPADCPPTLVVQHIGHDFVAGFARRLNRICRASVAEAVDGAPIASGQVLVAPGQPAHLTIAPRATTCRLTPTEPVSGHRPSVDALFSSAARLGSSIVAVLLTGMGRDGADGMLQIRQAGGHTIAQDEATSVVYGMPRVAFELGGVTEKLPIERIGPALLQAADHLEKGRAI
ncbi:CheB methylesterase domain-containing protein [Marinibacterium profundimaris]|uniref:CheB methylesterase domain-containing protein n=1 Tax=Marinibacterium profundimaris TaxID=1679460 RepID=UPI000B51FD1A|nr:CheB methylesterase domain-containing protein [Marinibacterium profundimaris]